MDQKRVLTQLFWAWHVTWVTLPSKSWVDKKRTSCSLIFPRDSNDITVKHLTLGLVKLVTLNLINKIQDYGWAICSTSFTVTRKWTVTPISFYEIIEFYQNQVLTLANSYVICWYSPSRKKMKNHDDNFKKSAIKPIEFRSLRLKSYQLRLSFLKYDNLNQTRYSIFYLQLFSIKIMISNDFLTVNHPTHWVISKNAWVGLFCYISYVHKLT